MVDLDVGSQSSPISVADLTADGIQVVSLNTFATTWAVQRSNFAWLLGAGVSASAGVPLANAIRDRLLFDRYAAEHQLIRQDLDESDPNQVGRVRAYFDGKHGMPRIGSAEDYSAAFELCLPESSARRALLASLIENVQPGFGLRVFGGLVVAGACDLAITTNFDRLLERGIAEAQRSGTDLGLDQPRELNVAGIDSTARAATAIRERRWPLVVKLHGDFREKRLMNTDSELRTQDETLRQFVLDVSRQFGLVVGGYSGRDVSVIQMLMSTLSSADAWPYGIWWITRPTSPMLPAVRTLLKQAVASGVSASVVTAASFDDVMTSLARQVVVDQHMRDYFERLHPRPRAVPAAIPTPTREWPVLRFNALPVLSADVTVSRVALQTGWTRTEVRDAMQPRRSWPIVVNGPGEVIFTGNPVDAIVALTQAAAQRNLPKPGRVEAVRLDLLAQDAPSHHQAVLLQAVANALADALPIWPRTGHGGIQELVVRAPFEGEPSEFAGMRSILSRAYGDRLFGELGPGQGGGEHNIRRRWAEEIEVFYERRADRDWLLFRPYTWVAARPSADERRPAKRADLDPASTWRAQRWAKRRFNEKWAAIIEAWTTLLAPRDPTELTVRTQDEGADLGRIVLGRTNAYSRPA